MDPVVGENNRHGPLSGGGLRRCSISLQDNDSHNSGLENEGRFVGPIPRPLQSRPSLREEGR